MARGRRTGRRVARRPISRWQLMVFLLVLGGTFWVLRQEYLDKERAYQYFQEDQARRRAAAEAHFSGLQVDAALQHCREAWGDRLGLRHYPEALAWTRQGVDSYFLDGVDRSSLRQVRCVGEGVTLGGRIRHPLQAELAAEAPGEDQQPDDDAWRVAMTRLRNLENPGELLALELLRQPDDGTLLWREWRGLEGGARSSVRLIDGEAQVHSSVRSFPLLFDTPLPLAAGEQVARVERLRPNDWGRRPLAALDLLAAQLAADTGISEIHIEAGRLKLTVHAPTPAFDGNPPAPYGDLDFDEYGIASRNWWYPRETPGFGCPRGRPLAALRAELEAQLGQSRLASAWYSCSPAYSDGQRGVWHLRRQGE